MHHETGESLALLLLRGHQSGYAVYAIAFSPDGASLASCSRDRTIRLWDLRDGTHRILSQTHYLPYCLAFSRDGRTLAWPDCGTAQRCDVTTAYSQPLPREQNSLLPFSKMCFSPDGRTLAAGRTEWGTGLPRFHVDLWDLETRKTRATLAAKRGATDLAFAPDGRTLAATCGECLLVWDLATEEPIFQHQSGKRHIQGLAFSPGGRLLATAHNDRTVRLWRTSDWKEQAAFNWRIGDVLCVAFAPDGMTAAVGGRSGRIVLWDVDL